MGFRMKSHRLSILAGVSFLVFAVVLLANRPALADPMTGGNVPYEDCAPPCSNSTYTPPPRCPWYFYADAVGLRRDPLDNVPFASLANNATPDIALSTSELDRQYKGGVQFVFGYNLADTPYSIEGSYFQIDAWDSTAALRNTSANGLGGTGNLFSPFSNFGNPPVLGFDYDNLVSVRNMSWLKNGELNVKYLLPMPWNGFRASFLTGVRYVSVEEQLYYHSESSAGGGSSADFSARTTNGLIGPQIGGYFEFFTVPGSWVTFEAKGAICGNNASSTTANVANGQFAGYDRTATAFVGDIQLMFNLQVTSHCIARFGYQAMWVDGLALAAQNLGPSGAAVVAGNSGAATIDVGGNVVYHGPHLGLEITW
jgi:hypothetical protein